MGAHKAVHVVDDAIHGSDAVATSAILAEAIGKLDPQPDLVMTGMASTDGIMGVVPTMLAERLGLPAVTFASELTVGDGTVTVRRDDDAASQTIEATLPALVSVTDQINKPRYPSFKGIMAAKKKPVDTWSLADLGIEPSAGRARRRVDQGRVVSPRARRVRRARSSPTRATAARSSPRSSPSTSSSDRLTAPLSSAGKEIRTPWLKYSSSSTTPTARSARPRPSC